MAEWHILVAVVWENSFEPGDPSLKQIRREPKLLAEKNEKERKKVVEETKGSPISKAPVKRHRTTSPCHSVNGAACGMSTSPFSLHAHVTESHPGCLRQSCLLHTAKN